MAEALHKSLYEPDEVVDFPLIKTSIVELGDLTDDEILVSDPIRALGSAGGLAFEDRGTYGLKGLEGRWQLAAFVPEG